jgi:hypothetical protein
MSKFFKYLGIGSAIGVIAYGVIKYKSDQKFKEKVDGVSDKVKEKADKVITKASNFAADHPILTTAAFAAAVFVPIIAFRNAMEPTIAHYQDIVESVTDGCDGIDPDDPINDAYEYDKRARGNDELRYQLEQILTDPENYLIVPKGDYEKYQKAYETKSDTVDPPPAIFNNWKEEYRDTWDEVHELSNRITLAPGESYMIEEPRQLGLDTDQHVISHMIYGESCYPPDVKDDNFIPRNGS